MGRKSKSGGCCGWLIVALVLLLVVIAVVYGVKKKLEPDDVIVVPGPPGAVEKKYANALKVAVQFFDVQKCTFLSSILLSSFAIANFIICFIWFIDLCCINAAGKLEDNKISWRGDSALQDGSEAKLDLSKGMYDAGDHMKFGFPMAFTATVLSWAILEYGDQMDAVNQLEAAQDSLQWITDYLINAHAKANVLYIQVI